MWDSLKELFTTKAGKSYPWEKCIADQTRRYGSKDRAEKVCASIKRKYGHSSKEASSDLLIPEGMTIEGMLLAVEDEMSFGVDEAPLTDAEQNRVNTLMAQVDAGLELKESVNEKATHSYHSAKMERCLIDLKKKGADARKAHRICYAALGANANKEIHELICHKAITDAPNLRGDDTQHCTNCNLFQWLPSRDASVATSSTGEVATIWENRGICKQYEFETDGDWVCDSWEEIPQRETVIVEIQAKEFATHKQTDGHYRWLLASSSSFRDRDNEIVSQKALENDAEQMNATGNFGTLDWWHLCYLDGEWHSAKELTAGQFKRAIPLRLGTCDFSAMDGMVSIESGTFDDDFVGAKLAEAAPDLAVSRSFFHSILEPDANGIYSKIRTVSRALLPRGKEANFLTQVTIASKESEMFEQKKKELIAKLGGDKAAEAKVNELLAAAEKSQQTALAAGVEHKETKPPEAPPEQKPEEKKEPWFLSDMTPEQFSQVLAKGLQVALEPVLAEVKSMKDAQATAVKESVSASNATIIAEIAKVVEKETELGKRVGALEGLTPRGYRASQDPNTKTTETKAKEAMPQNDSYAATFLQNMGIMPQQPKP